MERRKKKERHLSLAAEKQIQSLRLWEKKGSRKPLVCMWAMLDEDAEWEDSGGQHSRLVPEAHVLVGICSQIPGKDPLLFSEKETKKRNAKICWLSEGPRIKKDGEGNKKNVEEHITSSEEKHQLVMGDGTEKKMLAEEEESKTKKITFKSFQGCFYIRRLLHS